MPEAPARILVIDDEPGLATALGDSLRHCGHQVTTVAEGSEALALLRNARFDVLLTDLTMPGMDGVALLQEAVSADPLLVGIIMTGHGSIPTAVAAMSAGAVDYVLKPIKLDSLRRAVDRALAMRRLRAANAELERRVRSRAAELETANKDLEAFCHSVSHDLRTPLRAVSGFAELLRNQTRVELPREVRGYVDRICEGVDEMEQLIADLLAFSRLGRQALVRTTVDVEALCRDVFAYLESERQGRRVELRLGRLPKASADPTLLRQAVINLLSNAVKYTRPRETGIIEIGAKEAQGEPLPAYFVRDNGVGFDMRHAGRLFEVFERLHGDPEFEGTGVGLAIARRIIERHGGRIWAEAEPGKGACFAFTLPPDPAAE